VTEEERIVLVVPREAAGVRLDRFLSLTLSGSDLTLSRSELQRWIERGRVTVDGVTRKAADKLKEGSRIVVDPDAAPLSRALPEQGIEFEVMYVDDDLVVVNKPPGLVVHPARGHEAGTLVNGLLARGFFDAHVIADSRDKEGHLRPGIVHRLDKGTSGVMVIARTAAARERLKAQFQDHTIDREYEALCVGDVRARTFDTFHGRHPTDRKRFTTKLREGKRAITHVRVLERLAGGRATYVACRLGTGRTHQIRVHLAEGKTPVLGDPVYGSPPRDPALRVASEVLGHQALHARVLGFDHPTAGGRLRFEADPPDDFQRTLTALRAL
jgi:23S rRNA pseudouridine1911/1915/1917 synthase